jgi:hypothetical protein
MDWETYYQVGGACSVWIEKCGDRWQLFLKTKTGNYFVGVAADARACAGMLSLGGILPDNWIKVAPSA